jgi:hypothetical protein
LYDIVVVRHANGVSCCGSSACCLPLEPSLPCPYFLTEQARALPPQGRIALVEDVLDSLDRADPDTDRLWAREASDRLAAYRRGELAAKRPARHHRQIPAVKVRFLRSPRSNSIRRSTGTECMVCFLNQATTCVEAEGQLVLDWPRVTCRRSTEASTQERRWMCPFFAGGHAKTTSRERTTIASAAIVIGAG